MQYDIAEERMHGDLRGRTCAGVAQFRVSVVFSRCATSGDVCSSTCKEEQGYECTVGDLNTKSTCRSVCGNGLISNVEHCDDGKQKGDDGCTAACQITQGWECVGEPSVCGLVRVGTVRE